MQTKLKRTGENAAFAASNSRHGFYSYYEHCFRGRVDRILCIKGGPGTGKSTLMREVANMGQRHGYRAEYYYCSSDADSLDGVLLFGEQGSIGLLDATAPHPFEPSMPGVNGEVVDLGQFWNAEILGGEKEKIAALNEQKSEAYRVCYRCLSGVGELSDALRETMTPCLDEEKAERMSARLLKHTGKGDMAREEIRLCDSVGLHGCVQLDTYMRRAERLCLIEDYHDSAYALTARLLDGARERRLSVCVSHHPVLPNRIDALFLTETKTSFVVCKSGEAEALSALYPFARVISARRLLQKDALARAREEMRRLARLRQTLMVEACAQLSRAADAHFLLEQTYAKAMNFAAKERFSAELCRRIFK